MSVTLRKINEEDLEQIMRWRMDPEITRYMNTDPKLTLEGQKKWFAKVQQDPDVSYWIIQIDGTPAGVINYTGLMNPAGDLGWAYYVGEKKLRSIQAALALEMITLVVYTCYITYIVAYLKLDVAFAWTSEIVYSVGILVLCYFYMKKGKWSLKKI